MAKVPFDSIFIKHPDGSLEPRQRVRIGGVMLSQGSRFSRGVSFGGIDLFQFLGRDLEIQTENDITVITAIY